MERPRGTVGRPPKRMIRIVGTHNDAADNVVLAICAARVKELFLLRQKFVLGPSHDASHRGGS